MNAETRNCQNCKNDFQIEPGDFDFYAKIGVCIVDNNGVMHGVTSVHYIEEIVTSVKNLQ